MLWAIPFPEFDPVAFTIPFLGVPIRWYALAYIAGLLLGWRYIAYLVGKDRLWPNNRRPFQPDQVDDILLIMVFGVVIGGRLGYVLFYEPTFLWTFSDDEYFGFRILKAFEMWKGGMAFHGGFLGVVVGAILFARRTGAPLAQLGDSLACAAPFGILFGRIANFVNGELWGRPTEVSWGFVFQQPAQRPVFEDGTVGQSFADIYTGGVNVPRHPSQLYEAGLEGVLLALALAWLVWRGGALKKPGLCIGVFLAGYGLARFTAEFWRQYDPSLGNAGFDEFLGLALTRGQTLSLPMILIGVVVIYFALKNTWVPKDDVGGAATSADRAG